MLDVRHKPLDLSTDLHSLLLCGVEPLAQISEKYYDVEIRETPLIP